MPPCDLRRSRGFPLTLCARIKNASGFHHCLWMTSRNHRVLLATLQWTRDASHKTGSAQGSYSFRSDCATLMYVSRPYDAHQHINWHSFLSLSVCRLQWQSRRRTRTRHFIPDTLICVTKCRTSVYVLSSHLRHLLLLCIVLLISGRICTVCLSFYICPQN